MFRKRNVVIGLVLLALGRQGYVWVAHRLHAALDDKPAAATSAFCHELLAELGRTDHWESDDRAVPQRWLTHLPDRRLVVRLARSWEGKTFWGVKTEVQLDGKALSLFGETDLVQVEDKGGDTARQLREQALYHEQAGLRAVLGGGLHLETKEPPAATAKEASAFRKLLQPADATEVLAKP